MPAINARCKIQDITKLYNTEIYRSFMDAMSAISPCRKTRQKGNSRSFQLTIYEPVYENKKQQHNDTFQL